LVTPSDSDAPTDGHGRDESWLGYFWSFVPFS